MKLTERTKAITSPEYEEIERHEYKGVHFFTAYYKQMNHVVLEPIHKEVLDMINSHSVTDEFLWHDSGHIWARGLTIEMQRKRLIEYAKNDIDSILKGELLKDQRKDYLKTRKKLQEQLKFFKEIKKDGK